MILLAVVDLVGGDFWGSRAEESSRSMSTSSSTKENVGLVFIRIFTGAEWFSIFGSEATHLD
jgi:hypothetical protein